MYRSSKSYGFVVVVEKEEVNVPIPSFNIFIIFFFFCIFYLLLSKFCVFNLLLFSKFCTIPLITYDCHVNNPC